MTYIEREYMKTSKKFLNEQAQSPYALGIFYSTLATLDSRHLKKLVIEKFLFLYK